MALEAIAPEISRIPPKQQLIADWRNDVVENRADDQCQAGAQRKSHRHAGDGNGSHQKQVPEIENHSASKRFRQGTSTRTIEIVKEPCRSRGIRPAQGETKQQGARYNPHM